jgi:hypothetical protein
VISFCQKQPLHRLKPCFWRASRSAGAGRAGPSVATLEEWCFQYYPQHYPPLRGQQNGVFIAQKYIVQIASDVRGHISENLTKLPICLSLLSGGLQALP